MSKDGSRLSRLGVLAPAALSACMDASVLAVPAAGAIVSTVLKELSKAFMLKKWFHGSMSAKEAENLMMEKGKNGSFLVRESKARPGDYVLTVRVRGRVSHILIRKQHNKYDVGNGEQFDDLVGLIEHFRSYPMTETSGDVLRLLQPVSGTRVRANDIHNKMNEMQKIDDTVNLDGNCGFEGEFQSLQKTENLNYFTTIEGNRPENICKNRYKNVIPFDQTRVVLRRRNDRIGGDYINANYIKTSVCDSNSSHSSSNESLDSFKSLKFRPEFTKKKIVPLVSKSLSEDALKDVKRKMKLDKLNGNLFKDTGKEKTYIATQGCLSNTRDDFWRMIWQEDVRVIVMITNEYEKGKKKCERYWPPSGTEADYEGLTVRTASEIFYEDYILREIDVRDEASTLRIVYQYQFTAWPDHSTPAMPDGLVSFIEVVNKRLEMIAETKNRPDKDVICVHCSAGVGRTGTYIVLDTLISKIKNTGYNCDIDVHDTVKLVRSQRSGMVQNKSQYKFIYYALQQFIEKRHLQRTSKVYSIDM